MTNLTVEYTKTKLNKIYQEPWYYLGRLLISLLGSRMEVLDRAKGKVQRFNITGDLPTQEEVTAKLTATHTYSASDLISSAYSQIVELRDEITEWKDNIEEHFPDSEKYSQLEDALDPLDRYADDEPEWPEEIEDFKVVLIPRPPKMFRGVPSISRSTRLFAALDEIEAVTNVLDDLSNDESKSEDARIVAGDLYTELEEARGELEGVEFPGMFG